MVRMKRDSFSGMLEYSKCDFLANLGRISCAFAGSLRQRPYGGESGTEMLFCYICDYEDSKDDISTGIPCPGYDTLRQILVSILPHLTRASSSRVAAMVALRRLLLHDSNSNQMQLASSVFGEFCLNSLRSSVRELRVVTGYYSLHMNLLPFASFCRPAKEINRFPGTQS